MNTIWAIEWKLWFSLPPSLYSTFSCWISCSVYSYGGIRGTYQHFGPQGGQDSGFPSPRSALGYPFPAMHQNSYSGYHLGSYAPPCASPPKDGKWKSIYNFYKYIYITSGSLWLCSATSHTRISYVLSSHCFAQFKISWGLSISLLCLSLSLFSSLFLYANSHILATLELKYPTPSSAFVVAAFVDTTWLWH